MQSILSIFLTDKYISALLIKADPFSVVQSYIEKIPYEFDEFNAKLTNKKLSKIIENFKIPDEYKNAQRIISASSDFIPLDINIDYILEKLLDLIPYPIIVLDHFSNKSFLQLKEDEVNKYLNSKKYDIEVSYLTRVFLDSAYMKEYAKNHTSEFIDQNEIIITTMPIVGSKNKEYLDELIKTFADEIKIAGIWKFALDTTLSFVPLISAIVHLELNLKEFFDSQPINSDGKLIVAPGVEEIQILDENKKPTGESYKLETESINKFELPEDKSVIIKWNASGSKFEGKISGSDIGLIIDSRKRNNAK